MTQFTRPIHAVFIVGSLVADEVDVGGTSGQPRVRITTAFFTPTSSEISMQTGDADATAGATITNAITGNRQALRLISGALDNNNVAAMALISEPRDPNSPVNNPQVIFDDFGGSVPPNQGIFWVTDVFRALFEGNVEIDGTLQADGNIDANGNLDVAGTSIFRDDVDLVSPAGLTSAVMRPSESADAGNVTINTTGYTATNNSAQVFTAPPSGVIRVDWHTHLAIALSANVNRSAFCSIEVRTGGTLGGGSVVGGFSFLDAYSVRKGIGATSGLAASLEASTYRLITGLTPGNTYHVRFGYRVDSTTNVTASAARRHMLLTPCT